MVFIQNLIYLLREFDEEEQDKWSNLSNFNNTDNKQWCTFEDYAAYLIKNFKDSNILNNKLAVLQKESDQNYYVIVTFASFFYFIILI